MANWETFEAEAPELAAAVLARFDAHAHKTMATLRRDGSPRISGIEIGIFGGEVWIAGISGSRKFVDLRRDGRVALHSGSDDAGGDGSGWAGDAKLSGVAIEIVDEAERAVFRKKAPGPPGPFELFRLDILDASTVRVGVPANHLVIEHWRPGQPVRRMKQQ